MRNLILSFFGVGYLKPAPGTWGSLAALPVGYAIHATLGPGMLILAASVLFAIGTLLTEQAIKNGGDHDPSWIVIDEVVGQWIALLPVAFGAYWTGKAMIDLWPGIIAAFAFFRLFDILKPWLAGKADRRGDALGVMLDDVWAGVFAAISVFVLAGPAHTLLAL